MTEKKDNIERELKKLQYLLAGLLLNKKPNIKQVAKVIGVSDKTLTKFYPEKKGKKAKKNDK